MTGKSPRKSPQQIKADQKAAQAREIAARDVWRVPMRTLRTMSGSEYAVWQQLISHANRDGFIWASHDQLANGKLEKKSGVMTPGCGLSDRTVRRTLVGMYHAGLVVWVNVAGHGAIYAPMPWLDRKGTVKLSRIGDVDVLVSEGAINTPDIPSRLTVCVKYAEPVSPDKLTAHPGQIDLAARTDCPPTPDRLTDNLEGSGKGSSPPSSSEEDPPAPGENELDEGDEEGPKEPSSASRKPQAKRKAKTRQNPHVQFSSSSSGTPDNLSGVQNGHTHDLLNGTPSRAEAEVLLRDVRPQDLQATAQVHRVQPSDFSSLFSFNRGRLERAPESYRGTVA